MNQANTTFKYFIQPHKELRKSLKQPRDKDPRQLQTDKLKDKRYYTDFGKGHTNRQISSTGREVSRDVHEGSQVLFRTMILPRIREYMTTYQSL